MSDAAGIAVEELTGILREVAEVAGVTAAHLLARNFGGLEIYVPRHLRAEHPLIEAVGRKAADALVDLYGGGHIEVPMGPDTDAGRKRRQIARLIAEGKTNAQIARTVHCHIRTVRRVRNTGKTDHRQPDLFNGA